MKLFGHLYWDPSSEFIVLPFLDLPITWYGFLFASSFWIGFYLFSSIFHKFLLMQTDFREGDVDWEAWRKRRPVTLSSLKDGELQTCNKLLTTWQGNENALFKESKKKFSLAKRLYGEKTTNLLLKRLLLEDKFPDIFIPIKQRARNFSEKLLIYVLIATVLGARLGHILFYEHPIEYLMNPLSILKTWEGGLASHGGVVAIIVALYLFHRKSKKLIPEFTLWHLLDYIAIPTMFVAGMIRIGNFFNQEILGIESVQPWAIVFGHPADGSFPYPRHPAQLYESVFYFSIFIALYLLWKRNGANFSPGRYAGIAIATSFGFRFFIEFLKEEQSQWLLGGNLLMGQILSIPLVLIGFYLIFRKGELSKLTST